LMPRSLYKLISYLVLARCDTIMSSLPKHSASISESPTSMALPCLSQAWWMLHLISLMNTKTFRHNILLLNWKSP
jgi:hypothetical protein